MFHSGKRCGYFFLLSFLAFSAFILTVREPVALADYDSGDIAIVEDVTGELADMMTQGMPNVWLHIVACNFFLTHHDQYDAIFVFSAGLLSGITNTQQGWPVYSPSKGIGRGYASQGDYFCSYSHRLRQAVKMGEINILPANPDDNAPIVPFYPLTGVQLVGHEFGHQWLAAVKYDKDDGKGQQCLLRGYEPTSGEGGSVGGEKCGDYYEADFNQHWSYYSNSRSLMYGSMLEDNGNGTFALNYENPKFSELDQYLMGLRLPEDVSEYFFVDVGDVTGSAAIPPMPGSSSGTITGTRVNVAIEDIIRVMGPREPALENCHWKAAWIIVHPQGLPPSPQQIAKVETYRQRWSSFYAWATDNRGSFDSSLDGCGTGTETCQGEVSEYCGAVACSDGQRRCKTANLVEECSSEEWNIVEECVYPDVCINGECSQNPVDGDEETDGDEAVEDGDEPIVDGDNNKPDGDIPVDEDGDSEEPIGGGECNAGDVRCIGDVYYKCSNTGKGWIETDCSVLNKVCVAESGCVDSGSGADDGASGGCNGGANPVGLLLLALTAGVFIRRKMI